MVSVTSQDSHLGTNEGSVGSYHSTNEAKCFACQISLSPNLILLDSCSMCLVCNDSSLLHNVQHFEYHGLSQGLRIVSNGGTMDCEQVGNIGTLSFPVWYNANSIANILSMSEVAQDWRLTMDTSVEMRFGCIGMTDRFSSLWSVLAVYMLMIELIQIIRLPHTLSTSKL